MRPRCVSLHIAPRNLSCSSDGYDVHSEKLRRSRACRTSLATSHDAGATFVYHGHRLSLEWQSRHERSRIAVIPGGVFASSEAAGDAGGLVRFGRTNWMPMKATRTNVRTRRAQRAIRKAAMR